MAENILLDKEHQKKIKEELKRVKALTGSALVSNPTLQDNTSELISNIGVLFNGTDNNSGQ